MSFKFWAAVSIKHRGVWDSWLFCHHQCLAWIHLDPSSILRPPVCHYKCHVICNMKKKIWWIWFLFCMLILCYRTLMTEKKWRRKKRVWGYLGATFSVYSVDLRCHILKFRGTLNLTWVIHQSQHPSFYCFLSILYYTKLN